MRHFPGVKRAWLSLTPEQCPFPEGRICSERDYACADLRTGEIVFASRALKLPKANVVALIRHELAHIADPTPGKPFAELRADEIARVVTGFKIFYDKDLVQTTDPTAPHAIRPNSLVL